MVVQESTFGYRQRTVELLLSNDHRVQEEFRELNQFLDRITERPVGEAPAENELAWKIDDQEVSRWLITFEGSVNLEGIASFRKQLESRDDVVRARVEDFNNGKISIRLVTTGGIPMGPLERAVGSLKAHSIQKA